MVQINSISWASTVFDDNLLVSMRVRRYSTRLQIASATIRAWS